MVQSHQYNNFFNLVLPVHFLPLSPWKPLGARLFDSGPIRTDDCISGCSSFNSIANRRKDPSGIFLPRTPTNLPRNSNGPFLPLVPKKPVFFCENLVFV